MNLTRPRKQRRQEPPNTVEAYSTFVTYVREELEICRKKDSSARVVVRLDLIPLYNPATKTYRNVTSQERLGWFVQICNRDKYIYSSHRIHVSMDVVSEIHSEIHAT